MCVRERERKRGFEITTQRAFRGAGAVLVESSSDAIFRKPQRPLPLRLERLSPPPVRLGSSVSTPSH